MGILHVRNVPDDLLARLRERARRNRRSLSAEVVMALESDLGQRQGDAAEVLAALRALRLAYPTRPDIPDSVTMIREDRER